MARYKGPKDKLSRREGFDLFGKGSRLTRLMIPPGVHGQKRAMRPSRYQTQLREKQKVKRLYGVLERQFGRYVEKALKSRGNTGEALLTLLEKRLDNAVFRLGFAPTRPSARQIVSHKGVTVNGKRTNVPSFEVSVGDTIALLPKAQSIPATKKLLADENIKIPGWLERKAAVGRVKKEPKREDILEAISEQEIVEFYSR